MNGVAALRRKAGDGLDEYCFRPIGVVRAAESGTDLGPLSREEIRDREVIIEIDDKYLAGLADIDGFSHLYILFVFHRSTYRHLEAHPPMDDQPRGVFATRSPHRPTPIGQTIVRLLTREENRLMVTGADMIDGTPVLDIKPYTRSDRIETIREGWLETIDGNDRRRRNGG